jgi:hypothetical protein
LAGFLLYSRVIGGFAMNSKRKIAKTLMIVASFALGLMLQTTAAEAGRKHKDRHKVKRNDHRHEQRYDRHDRHDRRRVDRYGYDYRIVDGYRYDNRHYRRWERRHTHFRIPDRIRYRASAEYRPYLYAERFHRGHGHMHLIYRFPVRTRYGVDYVAVSYCEGRHFRTGQFVWEGDRYGFRIRF